MSTQTPAQTPPMNTPPSSKPRRIKWWQWALIGVGALLALGVVANATSGGTNKSSSSTTSATQPSQATKPPAQQPTQPPATTPPKQLVVLQKFEGNQNTKTPTFHVPDGATLEWSAKPTDQYGGTFSITSYTANGHYGDLIANTMVSSPESGKYTFHGAADIYLDVSALNASYTITISAYQ